MSCTQRIGLGCYQLPFCITQCIELVVLEPKTLTQIYHNVVRGWHGVWELHLSARVTTSNFSKLLGHTILFNNKKQTKQ